MDIFNCCVGATIARASLCLDFAFWIACYRYLLLTFLSLYGCVDYVNCTCNLPSSLVKHHYTCMVIFPCVYIESIHRQWWLKTRPFVGSRMLAIFPQKEKNYLVRWWHLLYGPRTLFTLKFMEVGILSTPPPLTGGCVASPLPPLGIFYYPSTHGI